LLYGGIRCATETGMRTLEVGSMDYKLKQRLGLQVNDDNHIVVVGNGPLFQQLGRWMAKSEEGAAWDES
jgi:hypothetical protein